MKCLYVHCQVTISTVVIMHTTKESVICSMSDQDEEESRLRTARPGGETMLESRAILGDPRQENQVCLQSSLMSLHHVCTCFPGKSLQIRWVSVCPFTLVQALLCASALLISASVFCTSHLGLTNFGQVYRPAL